MAVAPETIPATKGLFAHIQENNFRSIALFAWFVVLLEILYVTTSVILISIGRPIEQMFASAFGRDHQFSSMNTMQFGQIGEHATGNPIFAMVPKSIGKFGLFSGNATHCSAASHW